MQISLVPRTAGLLAIALALTALPACRRPQPPDADQPTLPSVNEAPRTAEDVLRLVQKKNRALAELESEAFETSIVLWEELAEELPDEPSLATNLVVAYILLLKSLQGRSPRPVSPGVGTFDASPCRNREDLFRPAAPAPVEACAVGDVAGDGDWDLLVVQPERLVWYANQGGNQNHWLDVRLRADPHPSRSPDLAVNMHGLGSLLEVKTGSRCQRQLVTRSPSHFGLGAYSEADVVRILWTNGKPCNTIDAESNRVLFKEQKHEGM